MAESLDTANLVNRNNEIVATVQVTAFPYNPGIVEWEGRYFDNMNIGYGVSALSYTEDTVFHAVSEKPPSKPEK